MNDELYSGRANDLTVRQTDAGYVMLWQKPRSRTHQVL